MSGIRQVRTKAAEDCFGNASGWIAGLTDISCKPGFIEGSAANHAFANHRNSGSHRPNAGSEKRKNSYSRTPNTDHQCFLLFGKLSATKIARKGQTKREQLMKI